jgi:lipopolysaccharide assembly protein A
MSRWITRALSWLFRCLCFFTLFAFALNNPHDITVHFFFGTQWTAPLVIVTLVIFTAGIFVGIIGMVPRWWRHRKTVEINPKPAAGIANPLDAARKSGI